MTPLCFWPGGEAANPDALHPGKARKKRWGKENNFRLLRWNLRKLEGFWPKKSGKIPQGKITFPWDYSQAFPGCEASGEGGSFRRLNRRKSAQRTLLVSPDLTADEIPATGGHRRFVRRARSSTASRLTSSFLYATVGTRLDRQCKQHPLLRVQGRSPDNRRWRLSCPG